MSDEELMLLALQEAKKAAEEGEIPVGAVVARNGEVVASAHNLRERNKDVTAHAECLALRAAGEILGNWRLFECTLYVTLEPCTMCGGALLAARISRIVYGATDPAAGAFGSVLNLPRLPFSCHPQIEGGLMANEAQVLLSEFFQKKR